MSSKSGREAKKKSLSTESIGFDTPADSGGWPSWANQAPASSPTSSPSFLPINGKPADGSVKSGKHEEQAQQITFFDVYDPFSTLIDKRLKPHFQRVVDEAGTSKVVVFNDLMKDYLRAAGVDLDSPPPPVSTTPHIRRRRRSSSPLRASYDTFSCALEKPVKAHLERYAENKPISLVILVNQAIYDFLMTSGVDPHILPPRL